jgi:AAA family ATP:ADP antiporter
MFGQGAGLVAVAGAICALLWGYLGWQLGKQADRRTEVAGVVEATC